MRSYPGVYFPGSVQYFRGDPPTYKIVETVGLQPEFHAAFVADGFPQFSLIVGRYLGSIFVLVPLARARTISR